jgi:hypothetical protein
MSGSLGSGPVVDDVAIRSNERPLPDESLAIATAGSANAPTRDRAISIVDVNARVDGPPFSLAGLGGKPIRHLFPAFKS